MIDFYFVDVKSINSDIPRSEFTESDLDNLAQIILESGGIIQPLLLKQTAAETYSIIDGHFEYYAAVRAREKDPRKGEMVNALVISPKVEELVLQQVEILRASDTSVEPEISTPESKTENKSKSKNESKTDMKTDRKTSDSSITNIELRLEKYFNELRAELIQEKQRVDNKFKQLEKQQKEDIKPLDAFNDLEVSQLTLRLKDTGGFSDKDVNSIIQSIEKERNKKKFDSLSDVINRVKIKRGKRYHKGISEKKMIEIVDRWFRIKFV
ncbi:MAG: chromosome partitioning protein ParB [Cyanobacteria bacterium P01_A01_bin.84]